MEFQVANLSYAIASFGVTFLAMTIVISVQLWCIFSELKRIADVAEKSEVAGRGTDREGAGK